MYPGEMYGATNTFLQICKELKKVISGVCLETEGIIVSQQFVLMKKVWAQTIYSPSISNHICMKDITMSTKEGNGPITVR